MSRVALLLLAMSAVLPASAADLRAEIMNAGEHAEYSSESASLDDARYHLHHSLNCLVGPGGEGFDAKALDPCRGAGDGVIPDTRDAALARTFRAAAKERAALAEPDLAKVHADATEAAKAIVAALAQVK